MRKAAALATCTAALIGPAACSEMPQETQGEGKPALTVKVLDVGDADAICLFAENGETMVVDTGLAATYGALADCLREQGAEKIDKLVITHWHADHAGGAAQLIGDFAVGEIITADTDKVNEERIAVMAAAEQKGVPVEYVREGDRRTFGDMEMEFLNPPADGSFAGDENNMSLVFRLTCGSRSFLFMGDAEKKADKALAERYGSRLKTDFLKVGNHADKDAAGKAFLKAALPEVAVISGSNSGDDPDHVSEKALERIHKHTNARIYITQRDGDITAICDGESIKIEQERGK